MLLASVTDLASVLSSSAEAVEVDFDATALVMVVIFLALWLVLKPLLFDPMLKLFEERERRTDGEKLLARKIDEKSASALATYETEMQNARTTANAERDRVRAEGLKKEAEILARVRKATAAAIDEGRKQTQAELATARTALKNDVGTIAKDLASRALGREVHG